MSKEDNNTKNEKYINRTIYEALKDMVESNPNKTPINYMGVKIKYKKLFKTVKKQAKSLAKLGVENNSPVLTILPNQPENWELMYATNMLGGIYVPLLPTLAQKTLQKIILETETKNIFIYKDFYEKYERQLQNDKIDNIIIMDGTETIPNIFLIFNKIKEKISKKESTKKQIKKFKQRQLNSIPKLLSYKQFMKKRKKINIVDYENNKTAAYITTSGTTGIPKLVELTNENFNALALQHVLSIDYETGDKSLSIMPPSIAYGAGAAHYSLLLGFESILMPKLLTDENTYRTLWFKYKPEQFIGGPIHAELMIKTLEPKSDIEDIDKKRIKKLFKKYKNAKTIGEAIDMEIEDLLKIYRNAKNVVAGGAPTKKETENSLCEYKIKFGQGYGDTETTGGTIYNIPKKYVKYSVGMPFPLTKVKVCNPETKEEVPDGTAGELHVVTPTLMKAYYNNTEATEKAIFINELGEREHSTGDIVEKVGKYIFFKERMTDMFQRNGFNIHPSKIKEIIDTYLEPGEECAVIKVEHPDEQFVPVAFIAVDKDRDFEILSQEILENLRQNLDELAIPYEFVKVDAIPHNAGGKVDSKKLLEISKIDYSKKSNKKKKNKKARSR